PAATSSRSLSSLISGAGVQPGNRSSTPAARRPAKMAAFAWKRAAAGGFECDCTNTGYYGRICQRSNWSTWLARLLRPDTETTHYLVTNFRPLWSVVNRLTFLRRLFMRLVLKVRLGVVSVPPSFRAGVEVHDSRRFQQHVLLQPDSAARAFELPDTHGRSPKQLPTVGEVVAILFKRQPGQPFKPSAIGTNMLFGSFAQHFSHIPTLAASRLYVGDHNIYVSHLYGKNTEVENRLREFRRGGCAPSCCAARNSAVPQPAAYSCQTRRQTRVMSAANSQLAIRSPICCPRVPCGRRSTCASTNRVAGLLARLHPGWDDERIFQTTKLILIGKTLKIVVEEYVQHLSNYHFKLLFDPTLMHGEAMQYQNRIAAEFNLLYHWHPLMADDYRVAGTTRRLKDEMFNGTKLLDHSSRDYVEGLVNSIGGSFTANNHPEPTLIAARAAVQMGRTLRLQSLNAYRKAIPIEAVQDLPGVGRWRRGPRLRPALALQRRGRGGVLPGLVWSGTAACHVWLLHDRNRSPYSLQGIFGNALASPQ
uniref:EGF-like domain-containing protein n=1 Tax=Macrostomum lignano TaxID=282301 RepID=A0A1I8F3T1_9PLAT